MKLAVVFILISFKILSQNHEFGTLFNNDFILEAQSFKDFTEDYFTKERKFPEYLKPFCGDQWFCINSDASKYIIAFINKYPDYLRYHKDSLLPDEMFFQSILLNTMDLKINENIINSTLKYIDWSKPNPPYPAIIGMDDFDACEKSEMLFARKFDLRVDKNILDKIDERLRK